MRVLQCHQKSNTKARWSVWQFSHHRQREKAQHGRLLLTRLRRSRCTEGTRFERVFIVHRSLCTFRCTQICSYGVIALATERGQCYIAAVATGGAQLLPSVHFSRSWKVALVIWAGLKLFSLRELLSFCLLYYPSPFHVLLVCYLWVRWCPFKTALLVCYLGWGAHGCPWCPFRTVSFVV